MPGRHYAPEAGPDLSQFAPGAARVADTLRANAVIQLAVSLAHDEPALFTDRVEGEINIRRTVLDRRRLTDKERERLPEAQFIVDALANAIQASETARRLSAGQRPARVRRA